MRQQQRKRLLPLLLLPLLLRVALAAGAATFS
jgi:hypothetical protein